MRFKVDENLPDSVAELLRKAGHDAETVGEEHLLGSDDSPVARVAREEKRAIITLDKHFANERLYSPSDYHGLIVIRGRKGELRMKWLLGVILSALPTVPLDGCLWIMEEDRIRIRRSRRATDLFLPEN